MFTKYLLLFLLSMVPIIELRGAIPVAVGWDLNLPLSYLVSVIGNILPVPFIILFGKFILSKLAGVKKIGPFFQKIIDRADRKAKTLGKAELWGLYLFVAIPLPGTGAWTGALIAAILRLRLKNAFFAIAMGVITAGVIMLLVSLGVFSGIDFLFNL
ncbi:MAG: small multidrug export protein [Ruminococcaceae bacterium]|nr:small multidrug export protein [Oscillospiraceae bacterium]